MDKTPTTAPSADEIAKTVRELYPDADIGSVTVVRVQRRRGSRRQLTFSEERVEIPSPQEIARDQRATG